VYSPLARFGFVPILKGELPLQGQMIRCRNGKRSHPKVDEHRKGGWKMGKRLGLLGAVIALVALAVGAANPALGSSGDDDEGRTIRVVSITTEQEFLDIGTKGFGLGDEFVFSSKLLKGGEQVGHAGVVCTLTSVEREESECVATAWFHGGQIAAQGLVGNDESFVLPLTGGSGRYEGAEGEVHVRDVSDTKEILTFHLSD
jgi:hypothetical protein